MYRFGKADKVVPVTDGNGYKVMIYTSGGYVPMSALVDGEWEVCVFSTLQQAEAEMKNFNDFSWEND